MRTSTGRIPSTDPPNNPDIPVVRQIEAARRGKFIGAHRKFAAVPSARSTAAGTKSQYIHEAEVKDGCTNFLKLRDRLVGIQAEAARVHSLAERQSNILTRLHQQEESLVA